MIWFNSFMYMSVLSLKLFDKFLVLLNISYGIIKISFTIINIEIIFLKWMYKKIFNLQLFIIFIRNIGTFCSSVCFWCLVVLICFRYIFYYSILFYFSFDSNLFQHGITDSKLIFYISIFQCSISFYDLLLS